MDLLISKQFFQKINLTVPADDFLDVINQFKQEFRRDTYAMVFFWIGVYHQYISEILTHWGLCFTYNIAFSHDLLFLNATSDTFHYQNTIREINGKEWWHQPAPKILPKKLSTSKAGLWVGFKHLETKDSQHPYTGYIVLVHDPLELPTQRSQIVKFNPKYQTEFLIDPQLNSIDESLYEYEPAE